MYIWGTIRIVGAKWKVYGQPTAINYSGNGTAVHIQKKSTAGGALVDATNICGLFIEHINVQRAFAGDDGYTYWDTDLSKIVLWNGTTWLV